MRRSGNGPRRHSVLNLASSDHPSRVVSERADHPNRGEAQPSIWTYGVATEMTQRSHYLRWLGGLDHVREHVDICCGQLPEHELVVYLSLRKGDIW